MRPFTYERAADMAKAVRLGAGTGQGQVDAPVQYLAGGTTLVDLMKLDVLRPSRLVDLGGLASRHEHIEVSAKGLHLGAFATMANAANHPGVKALYPVVAESLQQAASAQLRNMATLGGNVPPTHALYILSRSIVVCVQ
jgi:xanthine dehydrogenase YagS FAD-binding subunit